MSQIMKLFAFVSSLPDEIKQTGGHYFNSRQIRLKAGAVSLRFEDGALRYISYGGHEIVRMIYFAARDSEWRTVKQKITDTEIEIGENSFRLSYNNQFESEEIKFSANFFIEGRADNSISFRVEGEALNTFRKNRIGFCILHPIEECAGNYCKITHTDDSVENLQFPSSVSPDQPFLNISRMEWQVENNLYRINFSGEVFETEDQRNWTDASYKTYSTPLSLPRPVTIPKGEKLIQSIEFIAEISSPINLKQPDTINLQIDDKEKDFLPQIGICHSSRSIPLTPDEVSALKLPGFDHYRIDVHLHSSQWKEFADIAVMDAFQLGLPVEFALFFDENSIARTEEFIDRASNYRPGITLISIFDTNAATTPAFLADTVIQRIQNDLPGVRTCCGTNANFAQLNRNRPASGRNDCICYSIHPQEHASDNTTLVENLRGQAYTVESAHEFANGKGIWISPVTIQRRFNANLGNYEKPELSDGFPPQADSRLMSLFGSCWTAGSLKYLCETGVKGITFYETAGERGIIQGDMPPRWPDRFKSAEGFIFPVFHLFRYVLKNKSLKVITSKSSDPLKVDVFAMSSGHLLKLIVINFTTEKQKIFITGISGEFKVKQLNTESFADAGIDPDWIEKSHGTRINPDEKITLEPFSLSFIDNLP